MFILLLFRLPPLILIWIYSIVCLFLLFSAHMVRVDESGYPVTHEARSLAENQMYEFWVSASTSVGEGEPTSVVAQATNTRGKFENWISIWFYRYLLLWLLHPTDTFCAFIYFLESLRENFEVVTKCYVLWKV